MHRLTLLLVCLAIGALMVLGHPEDPKNFEGKNLAEMQATLASHASARASRNARPSGCQGCRFAFTSPIMPSFDLPSAQPNSPGDVIINVGNPISFANGNQASGCNSKDVAYLADDDVWTYEYTDNNGHSKKLKNLFYTSGSNLLVRTIQSSSSNVESILSGHQVRMDVRCNNQDSCLHFFVNAEPKVDTCDQCAGLINRTAEDQELLILQDIHANYELFSSDLQATLNTMSPDASVLFFASGNGGAPRDGPSGTIEDFYANHVMFGKFFSQSDLEFGAYGAEVSDDHIIQEIYLSFNHSAPFDAFLPGLAPTYKKVQFVFVGFFKFDRETQLLLQERIYWDQGSVLKQLGLIDQDNTLPLVGGEWWSDKFTNPQGPPAFGQFFN